MALVSSLFTARLIRNFDRRAVLILFSVILVASNVLVAISDQFVSFLLARGVLGIALGGFWSMSSAVAMRLVPEAAVPKALSLIFGGVSVATVVAVPLGSFLGALIGWRGVFFAAAGLSLLGFLAQCVYLPSMKPVAEKTSDSVIMVLRRPQFAIGLLAVALVFAGHLSFFTYLRPFLENRTGLHANGISIFLFGFGVANLCGTYASAYLLSKGLKLTLLLMPVLMTLIALGLIVAGGNTIITFVLVALWGAAFGCVPVAWSTWITKVVPDQAEVAGGLLVAAIQIAITGGSALGGLAYHLQGLSGAMAFAAEVLLCAVVLIFFKIKQQQPLSGPITHVV